MLEISKEGVTGLRPLRWAYLMEKMGLTSSVLIDLKALMGISLIMSSVTKIGEEKTASSSLLKPRISRGIYENIDGMRHKR